MNDWLTLALAVELGICWLPLAPSHGPSPALPELRPRGLRFLRVPDGAGPAPIPKLPGRVPFPCDQEVRQAHGSSPEERRGTGGAPFAPGGRGASPHRKGFLTGGEGTVPASPVFPDKGIPFGERHGLQFLSRPLPHRFLNNRHQLLPLPRRYVVRSEGTRHGLWHGLRTTATQLLMPMAKDATRARKQRTKLNPLMTLLAQSPDGYVPALATIPPPPGELCHRRE